MQALFFEPSVQFEKSAAETMMGEDPNSWTSEIIQELYRQCPYAADFEPMVVMDRTDGERGFGFGHIEISNKTEIQHGAPTDATQAAGIKSARIPIVIKDRKLQPLDLLVTDESEILPLTEPRLRAAIFRPQAFDITGRGPGDMSMIGQLYPPYRQNYGFGGGGATMNVGMGKESQEKQASLLEVIRPTLNQSDVNKFFDKIAADRGLQAACVANAVSMEPAIRKLAEAPIVSSEKRASAILQRIKPDVAQLRKEAQGYSLKTAQHSFWLPEVRPMNRGEAVQLLGEKVVLAADLAGSSTMALGEGAAAGEAEDQVEQDEPTLISQFGIYKVQDEQGRHLIGYVFPNLIDLDGTALPIALFTNGSQKAVQGEIAGINVGGGASLFEGKPSGSGVFYHILDNGRAQATVPMTINSSIAAESQADVVLSGETFDGRPVQISIQPNIDQPTPSEDGHLLIPEWWCWLPLDKAEDTTLIGNPEEFNKEAQLTRALSSVTVRSDGESFSFAGLPIDKLAAEERDFLSLDDSLFLLGVLGTNLDYAMKKLGEAAAFSRPIDIRVGRYIKTARDSMHASIEKSAGVLASLPIARLRADLVKEAAVIPDPVAVDTVLSLGFLNPENLGAFVGYMPLIDQAQKKMCELLLAARLGLREIPVPALERAVRTTEEALEGLRILGFQQS